MNREARGEGATVFQPACPAESGSWHSIAATGLASHLLVTLLYLSRAVENGGQVSELHLASLIESAAELLQEVGGFEDVLALLEGPRG